MNNENKKKIFHINNEIEMNSFHINFNYKKKKTIIIIINKPCKLNHWSSLAPNWIGEIRYTILLHQRCCMTEPSRQYTCEWWRLHSFQVHYCIWVSFPKSKTIYSQTLLQTIWHQSKLNKNKIEIEIENNSNNWKTKESQSSEKSAQFLSCQTISKSSDPSSPKQLQNRTHLVLVWLAKELNRLQHHEQASSNQTWNAEATWASATPNQRCANCKSKFSLAFKQSERWRR